MRLQANQKDQVSGIKSKDGRLLTERTDVLERWSEHTGELYENDRGDKSAITENLEELPILVEEVKYVL